MVSLQRNTRTLYTIDFYKCEDFSLQAHYKKYNILMSFQQTGMQKCVNIKHQNTNNFHKNVKETIILQTAGISNNI